MSTNCLVEKLKGTVDNDSLLKINEVAFKVYAHEEAYAVKYTGRFSYDTLVYCKGNGSFTINGVNYTEFTCLAATDYEIEMANANFTFIVSNKHNIFHVTLTKYIGIDLKDTKYFTYLNRLICIGDNIYVTGDISVYEGNTTINKLALSSIPNIGGDISVISTMSELQDIRLALNGERVYGDTAAFRGKDFAFVSLDETNVHGNITDFNSAISCYIYITSCKNIIGTIEDYAAAVLARSPINGTSNYLSLNGSGVTYQGKPVTRITVTFNNGSYTVTPA